MRVYLVTDRDLEELYAAIDRDPRWGPEGGTSQMFTDQERDAHDKAHRFFNYQVRRWASRITAPGPSGGT